MAKTQAAGLMLVKNTTWYASADHAQCAVRMALIQRSGERRDVSSCTLTTIDASQSAMSAGHRASL